MRHGFSVDVRRCSALTFGGSNVNAARANVNANVNGRVRVCLPAQPPVVFEQGGWVGDKTLDL
jgi:hypothetical protein